LIDIPGSTNIQLRGLSIQKPQWVLQRSSRQPFGFARLSTRQRWFTFESKRPLSPLLYIAGREFLQCPHIIPNVVDAPAHWHKCDADKFGDSVRLVLLFRTCDWPIYWPLIERLLTAPRLSNGPRPSPGIWISACKLSFFEVIFMLQSCLTRSSFLPFLSLSSLSHGLEVSASYSSVRLSPVSERSDHGAAF
jgi:hypothetical protein